HRADAYLHVAQLQGIVSEENEWTLQNLRTGLLYASDGHIEEQQIEWLKVLTDSDKAPTIRSIVQIAIDALDRARPVLLRNERNVWWSTWYFELRIRAIELLLWATICD